MRILCTWVKKYGQNPELKEAQTFSTPDQELKQYKMVGSMSRKGNCYDNACIKSFHGILKRELVYRTTYKTRAEARKSLFEYIEFFYNSRRIHSTLEYHTPNEFEKMYFAKQSAA